MVVTMTRQPWEPCISGVKVDRSAGLQVWTSHHDLPRDAGPLLGSWRSPSLSLLRWMPCVLSVSGREQVPSKLRGGVRPPASEPTMPRRTCRCRLFARPRTGLWGGEERVILSVLSGRRQELQGARVTFLPRAVRAPLSSLYRKLTGKVSAAALTYSLAFFRLHCNGPLVVVTCCEELPLPGSDQDLKKEGRRCRLRVGMPGTTGLGDET